MSKYPSMPLFTDAYMADTRHLSAAQHGAYLLLLMTAWRMPDCRLPDDDVFLSRCAAMDLRTWRKNKDIVMAFWEKDEAQKFQQARLADERNYIDHMRRKNSAAGRASALKRLNRDSTTVERESSENPAPMPTSKKERKIKKAATGVVSKEKEEKASNRASRFNIKDLPESWFLYCEEKRPDIDPKVTFEIFSNYWMSKSGQGATKLDWFLTWQNWVRSQHRLPEPAGRRRQETPDESTARIMKELGYA